MPPSKKQKTAEVYNASDGPQEDNTRYANTLLEALAAPNLLHALQGAGGLVASWHIVGEHNEDEVDVLRAAVETAQAALQPPANVREADRTHPLAKWPLVGDKDKLGEGAPDSFFDGHLPEGAETLRKDRWTPQQWVIYLQALYQRQLKHPSRPKCCFCLSMLSYIDGDALVRALFRQAYGPMWLADGDCVLVNRLLMEAIADRTVRALMKEDEENGKEQWDRTTVISPRTDEKGVAKFVGWDKSSKNDTAARKAADCALQWSADGVAAGVYKYCSRLQKCDHAAKIWADVTATAMRHGCLVDGGVELPGDAAVFTASNVEDKDVSLALLEDGSAGRHGRLQLLVPVWCSVLKAMITMRVIIGRKSVDAVSEPSLEQTTDTRDAVMRLKNFEGSKTALKKVYAEANLVYKAEGRAKNSNGSTSWIVVKKGKYDRNKPEVLQGDLTAGLGGAERMRKAAHAVAGRVALRLKCSAADLAAHCEDPKERAQMYAIIAAAAEKARESLPELETIPSKTFSNGMIKDFETFAGAVEKELNLSGLGCITGVKGRKKSRPRPRARSPSRSRSPSPSSGPPRKKKKAPPPKKKKKKSNAGGNLFSDWTAEDFAGGVNGPSAPPRRRR
ncbi:unnamed protein product [Pelagomonas calceolata]|uniref:Uncharacterized protein n=3 Tax=Pelagomonas calceolata TaxID=35677 RepID=A0A8J2SUT7_9STRA|nr:unnamed protein product [Pelagomonas calceolata]